jgi:SH3-like domain-containing protein
MTMLLVSPPAAAQDKQPPYWASIASGEAMMRKGPGRNYPGTWLYKRRDLPVRVVKKGEPRPVRSDGSDSARVRYLAEPGAVGRIEQCRDGWCRVSFGKREGYIRTSDIWGVAPNEVVD